MRSGLPKLIVLSMLRAPFFVLFFFVLFCVAPNVEAAPKTLSAQQKIWPAMMDAIMAQSKGDKFTENWLKALSLKEDSGKDVDPSVGRSGNDAMGPLQQRGAFRKEVAGWLKISEAEYTAHIRSSDPKEASSWAVRGALLYWPKRLSACKNMGALLCGYNQGGGWCSGSKKAGFSPHPTEWKGCPDGYSTVACKLANIDCDTGEMGKTPEGEDSVVAGPVMNTGSNGAPPETGQINCPDLDLASAMQEATAAFSNAAVVNARTTFEASPLSDIRGTQCLIGFLRYFDLIRAILDAVNKIKALILMIIPIIIEAVCNYVLQAITNLINTALSYLCIPTLPGLRLPPLPPARACKGTPLVTFDWGPPPSGPGSTPSFFVNMSRGIAGPGGAFRF